MEKALFKTGDRVRYLGNREAGQGFSENEIQPLIFPGMEAEIVKTKPPTKGMGSVYHEGEWITDHDEDGYNVYRNEYGNEAIIWPEAKKDWERISKATV